MSEPQREKKLSSDAPDGVSKNAESNPPAQAETPPAETLTKEEQWAAFEKELKESDWGHQPC